MSLAAVEVSVFGDLRDFSFILYQLVLYMMSKAEKAILVCTPDSVYTISVSIVACDSTWCAVFIIK